MERAVEHQGCRIVADVTGTGPRVVFIQGVGVAGTGWRPQVDDLAAHYTCLTFDNRGMGRSQPRARFLTVSQMADDVLTLMDALGWSSAHLVGHSLGGQVAILAALNARHRVQSLSLLCTFANGRAVAPLSRRMMVLGLRTRVGTRSMRRRAFARLVMPPKPSLSGDRLDALSARLAPLFGHDLADQPPVVGDQLRAMRRTDLTSRLPQLAGIPTLVISGRFDPIAPPPLGRAIVDGIRGATYLEFDDGSHGLPIHLAIKTNEALRQHFRTADGAVTR